MAIYHVLRCIQQVPASLCMFKVEGSQWKIEGASL